MAEPDAAALVPAEVDDHAPALGRDLRERAVELEPAVAAHRAEDVAGEALAVHPHEDVVLAGDVAAHERHVLHAVEQALEHDRGELAVAGGDARLAHSPDQLLAVAAVADEVRDRDEVQPVLLRERLELGQPRHRAVVVHDLGEHAGLLEPREPGEVDRGLGVTGALEHAALAVAQREDVPGPRRSRPGGRRRR